MASTFLTDPSPQSCLCLLKMFFPVDSFYDVAACVTLKKTVNVSQRIESEIEGQGKRTESRLLHEGTDSSGALEL